MPERLGALAAVRRPAPPPGGRRRGPVALLAAAAVMLAAVGCEGVPTSGPVRYGRAVPPAGSVGLGDADVRTLSPPPQSGATPTEIVAGFLRAAANDDDLVIARRYLTAAASAGWHPEKGPVVQYDEASLQISVGAASRSGAAGTIAARRIGTIGEDGGYTLAPAAWRAPVRLQRTRDGWRLSAVPPQLLLTATDVLHSFRAVDLYFPDPTGSVLVPDRVLLHSTQAGLGTALLRALLRGPTAWLGPAVSAGFPTGTRLLGSVTRDRSGVVNVDLSGEVLTAPPAGLAGISAQVVWTLRQLTEVSGVRLLVEGQPLSVPGGSAGVQQRTDWASYDPDVLTTPVPRIWQVAGRVQGTAGAPGGLRSAAPLRLAQPAISPALDLLAGVRRVGGQVELDVGAVGSVPLSRLRAASLTAPSIDRTGTVWTVAGGPHPRVLAVRGPEVTHVSAAELLAAGPVVALRVSRDGTRVAAIVGRGAASRLLVGRVVRAAGQAPVLSGLRPVAPGLLDLTALSWADSSHVVVLARTRTPRSATSYPLTVQYDGSVDPAPISTGGLPGGIRTLAAAPGASLLVEAGTAIWQYRSGSWARLGPGSDPAYPG